MDALEANTLMFDIYQHFVGQKVIVFTASQTPLVGILKDCNAVVLHLINDHGTSDTYISCDKIIAISKD